jgi:poly(3-hydroxybutyrate) depolymerase
VLLLVSLAVVTAATAIGVFRTWPGGSDRQAGLAGTVRTVTSTGRRGAYYLPRSYQASAVPLLVILHGTRGTGSVMRSRLRDLAERRRFIVVAPDSVSVAGTWLIGEEAEDTSEDHRHVMACIREVLALPGVRVDAGHVLIAGFSVAGAVAAHIATREEAFSAFAVLHGHVVLDRLGPRRMRAWLSTGERDRLRTVEYTRGVAARLSRREGFPEVQTRVFRADHALGDEELVALVAWWLDDGS